MKRKAILCGAVLGVIIMLGVISFRIYQATHGAQGDQSVESLNVENDTFTFERAIEQIGKTETDLLAVLGEGPKDQIQTRLFGLDVVIDYTVERDVVRQITFSFSNMGLEKLQNVISESVGTDAKGRQDYLEWRHEDCLITLREENECCVICANGI